MPGTAGRPLVAVAAPPGEVVAAALAAALAGGPALLPVDPALPGPARDRLLAAVRPARLVDGDGAARTLPDPVPVPPEVAVVVATSGSEGAPKPVALTGRALEASARAGLARLPDPGARWLACLPTTHVGGLLVLVRGLVTGVPALVHPRFDVEAVRRAARDGEAARVALVPTMLRRLLDAAVPVDRFSTVLLGGAPAPPGLLPGARAAGVRVVASYGMTETAGGCVWDGVPLDGVEVAVDAGGRIAVRGPVLCAGYLRSGALVPVTDADGWFRTADLGRWLPDGRLEVRGRVDDVIVTGGEKVVAGEVAALVASHPRVAEAAVVGRPDPEWGQRVVAVVVPADPDHPPTLEDLRRHVAAAGPRAAAPRALEVVPALPRLRGGKLDRAALRAGQPPGGGCGGGPDGSDSAPDQPRGRDRPEQ